MKPNNNKEFYEKARLIALKAKCNVQQVLDDYFEYLVETEPESYHSVMIPNFIWSLRCELLDALAALKELDEESYHRFLRGLDLE